MPTNTQIANLALAALGGKHLISLDDASEEARRINDCYDLKRREALRAHPWNFAIKRAELGLLSTAPVFGYSNAFELPADCLRVLDCNRLTDREQGDEFKIEGQSLVSDAGSAKIRYIADITETALFDDAFVTYFAALLEAELAYSLANSPQKQQLASQKAVTLLRQARGSDGQEGTPRPVLQDEWIDARS